MRFRIAAPILVVCLTLVSCKGGSSPFQKSPGDVVKAFYSDANEGKYSEAKALFSTDGTKLLESDMAQLAGGLKGICDKETRNGTISRVDIVSEDIRGEGATVTANITFKDGSRMEGDKTALVLDGGSWKLTGGN